MPLLSQFPHDVCEALALDAAAGLRDLNHDLVLAETRIWALGVHGFGGENKSPARAAVDLPM